MINDDFHAIRIAVAPDEAHTPLIVDPYAVLSRAIPRERFQAISRRLP
jgi:hypothetical protein